MNVAEIALFNEHKNRALGASNAEFQAVNIYQEELLATERENNTLESINLLENALNNLILYAGVNKHAPIIWSLILDYMPTLTTKWRQHVRAGTFTGRSLGGFKGIWDEFSDTIFVPAIERSLSGPAPTAIVKQWANETISKQENYIFSFFDELCDLRVKGSEGRVFDLSDPKAFEVSCASLLKSIGWKAEITKGSGDQGVDVIAVKGLTKIVLQCKLYSSQVGNSAVQEIVAGRIHEQAAHGAVVSNSGFTRSASELANTNNIALLHYSELEDWVAAIK